MRLHYALLLSLCLAAASLSSYASAQDNRAQAALHFDRGLEFFNAGRLDAALAEFNQAYQIDPTPQALYNVAKTHALLNQPVESARALELYLRIAGPDVPRARRAEASAALEDQRRRIARVIVVLEESDTATRLSVDGVPVPDSARREPLLLSPGTHRIECLKDGEPPRAHPITIAGSEARTLYCDGTAAEPTTTEHGESTPTSDTQARAPVPSEPAPPPIRTYVVTGVSGAILATALGFFVWNRVAIANTDSDIVELKHDGRSCGDPVPAIDCTAARSRIRKLGADQERQNLIEIGAAFGIGLGAAALGGALYWLLTGDESPVEAPIAVLPGLNSLVVEGRF